jgi:hypothetical protein
MALKDKGELNKFFIFRPKEKIPEYIEVLKMSEDVEAYADHSIGREALEQLKEKIRAAGGNAVIDYRVENKPYFYGNYVSHAYIAHGKPALVVGITYKGDRDKLIAEFDDSEIRIDTAQRMAAEAEEARRIQRTELITRAVLGVVFGGLAIFVGYIAGVAFHLW